MLRASRWLLAGLLFARAGALVAADFPDTIERVKPSVVAVGTYRATDSPAFNLRGTGFVIGDGRSVATNAHVVNLDSFPADRQPMLMVMARVGGQTRTLRAQLVVTDPDHDLAILKLEESTLPALPLASTARVREGQDVAFTGFPIGNALGFVPVTHRGSVSAITPIVLPTPTARQLNAQAIRRIKGGLFDIYQLDATAYPGNSGSPVYDAVTGDVVAIINMVYVRGPKESAIGQPTGITYAIPVSHLEALLPALK